MSAINEMKIIKAKKNKQTKGKESIPYLDLITLFRSIHK
jgi:hypothetical protein